MTQSKHLIRAAALAAFAIAGAARAQFTITPEIRPGGEIMTVVLRDLDHDGKVDPVIAWRKTDEKGVQRRHVGFFTADAAGAFTAASDLDVPDDAIAFAVGDLTGAGKPQVIFLTSELVASLPPAGGAPVRVLEGRRSIFTAPVPDALPFWDYVFDLDGDGLDDLIFADAHGYTVFKQNAAHKLVEAGRIEPEHGFATGDDEDDDEGRGRGRKRGQTEATGGPPPAVARGAGLTSQPSPIVTGRSLARLLRADVNGDGRADLIAMKRDKLLALTQKPDGAFAGAADLTLPLGPQGARQAWANDARLPLAEADINGDKKADFVLADVDPKELSTKLRVHLWGADGPPKDPNQIIKLTGLGEEPRLVDVNGDGHPDLCYLTIRADKMMKMPKPNAEEIDAAYYVFLWRPAESQFSRQPDVKREYSIAVKQKGGEDRKQELANFSGDFNGDGLRDFLCFENRGELLIYFGEGGPAKFDIAGKPSLKQPMDEAPKSLDVVDLDGDKRSDLVVRHGERLEIWRSR